MLIQPAGQSWRYFHEVTLRWIGGIAILGMLILLVGFYLIRGMVRLKSGRSGRTIVRFSAFERFVHWMTATCFIILAISGLNITFGRPLLMPLMSPEAFTTWSEAAKYAHNFVSFPFTIGVVLIFLMWITGNIPNRVDAEWVKRGGGIVGDDHPPAYRFNAGQKMIYWIVVLGGAASAISGYLLMFPFYGDLTVSGMQTAQMVHSIVAVLFVAAMLAPHLYRHHRHGGRLRGHGHRRSRRELGARASQPVARRGTGPQPDGHADRGAGDAGGIAPPAQRILRSKRPAVPPPGALL